MTNESTPSTGNIARFQGLLRELFQYDCADLDFGIYRIMNHKRDVIERFVAETLPAAVSDELGQGALAEQAEAMAALEKARQAMKFALGPTGFDANGEPTEEVQEYSVVQAYLAAKERAGSSRSSDAVADSVYNHLYAFFSRYYDEGDFISKRRYSRSPHYAIPYNGEEVYLHWANSDQYYVKTDEHFRNYDWTAPNGVAVRFRMRSADVEQNNVKGDKRFFLPMPGGMEWDADARTLTLPFVYRPLKPDEQRAYSSPGQQDKIIASAVESLPRLLADAPDAVGALNGEQRRNGNGKVSRLEHHLRRYVQRNNSDFFIHKDLRGFLNRELDFYLKSEVLSLDEIASAGEQAAEGWFQLLRLIKAVGGQVIDFLAQIEDFQKMLWEKRKFVTETQYCVTLGNVDAALHGDIAANDAQWAEWRALFGVDGADRSAAFLQTHPTLVLDTRHFDAPFVDRLLASFDNIGAVTDGLLVHSENWQALNLLHERYQRAVRCIYIDPPYNTDASPIAYKNGYRSSSWVSLMQNRLHASRQSLSDDGIICITIDDHQVHELATLLSQTFGQQNNLGTVVIRNNPSGRSTVSGISVSHEYAFFYRNTEAATASGLPRSDEQMSRFSVENGQHVNWRNFQKDGGAVTYRTARPRQFYPIYADMQAGSVRIPKMTWNSAAQEWSLYENATANETVIWPIDERGRERVWSLGHESARQSIADLRVRVARDGRPLIDRRHIPSTGVLPRTWWDKKVYAAREYGSAALSNLFGEGGVFTFAKSPFATQDCLWVSGMEDGDSTALDYFAGSGTTGHAVINLNREDGGERKFILVEMGEYFDTVLLPRIKKVTYAPDWKDGKPVRTATGEEAERSPRIVKYVRLESYEDALDSIAFDEAAVQMQLGEPDEHLLKYMLRWETKQSETLLNTAMLTSPFSYRLRVHVNGEKQERTVDLPETFNYLLGLNVRTRRVCYDDDGRRYLAYRGETRADPGRRVAVIWRATEGWSERDFERDREFVAEQRLADGADKVYVNGDSIIPGACAVEPLFKQRMFPGVSA